MSQKVMCWQDGCTDGPVSETPRGAGVGATLQDLRIPVPAPSPWCMSLGSFQEGAAWGGSGVWLWGALGGALPMSAHSS